MKFLPIIGFRIFNKKCGQLLDQRLAPLGLNTTKARILAALKHQDGRTATDLLPVASVEPASMTLLLQGLEREGRIERRPHPTDKRASLLFLTEEGHQAQQQAWAVLEETNRDIFDILTDEERQELQQVMTRLTERMESLGVKCARSKTD
ncbi:MAG: MarR family transcriptional regulator [Armatimonadetes bacterium]|nr:MarR family transcriptional regulator [Armatimonadota bacterium]